MTLYAEPEAIQCINCGKDIECDWNAFQNEIFWVHTWTGKRECL